MPKMPSRKVLSAKISPEIRSVFDFIWQSFIITGAWPPDRVVYAKWPHPKLVKLFEKIDGTFLQEVGSPPAHKFQLQPLGILFTSRGDTYLDWLEQYMALARDTYYGSDRKSLKSNEAMDYLGLSIADTTELGRLFDAGLLYISPGHAQDFSWWDAPLPEGLKEMGRDGDSKPSLLLLLERHYTPGVSIWQEERNRRFSAAMPTFDTSIPAIAEERKATGSQSEGRSRQSGQKKGDTASLSERFKSHPVISVSVLCGVVAGLTWTVSNSTLVAIAERNVQLLERELTAEKTRAEQHELRAKTAESMLAELQNQRGASSGQNLATENAALLNELKRLQAEISEERAREWPALTDTQVDAWTSSLAGEKLKEVTVFWWQDVDARKFYRSLKRVGDRLSFSVQAGGGGGDPGTVIVLGNKDDSAVPVFARLLKDMGFTVRVVTAGSPVGEVSLTFGERS